jgi:hypothetical protein
MKPFMKHLGKLLLLSIIPTLALSNLIGNIPMSIQNGTKGMQLVTIIGLAFALSFLFAELLIEVREMERRIKELEDKLNNK